MACQRCGGILSTPSDTLAYSCPFCGSNKVLYREPLEDVLRPRFLIPFRVDPGACQANTKNWLGSSWMVPSELRNAAPEKFHPLYIPYWTFSAQANATWKAMVGHEKVESYIDEKGNRQERRTIDWRPETGRVNNSFKDLLVPGTQRLHMASLAKIDAYDLQDLVVYDPGFLAGMQAQAYDLRLEEAWEAGRHILRERTRQTCLDRIASPHVRNFNMVLDFADEQWRYILTPLYTSVYQYNDQPFQILINGQSGKIAGQRPVDWVKIWLVIAALLFPGALLGFASLVFARFEGGDIAGGISLFLLAVGAVIAFFIIRQAQEILND
jgi:predicted  nucleic acid-binding Zn-ribbon protein